MNIHALPFEFQTRQALAALRLIDAATGRAISDGARLVAPSLQFFRKPNGVFAVMGAKDGAPHIITVLPTTAAFLPRLFVLALPRSRNPGDAPSVFAAVDVPLFPSPAYAMPGGAYPLRVTVRRESDGARINGALVRVRRGALSETSMTDWAGEALIPITSLPPVVTAGVEVRQLIGVDIDIMVDAARARFTADAEVAASRKELLILDPDGLATTTIAHALTLNASRPTVVALTWTPP
jgi:hypothetical protein